MQNYGLQGDAAGKSVCIVDSLVCLVGVVTFVKQGCSRCRCLSHWAVNRATVCCSLIAMLRNAREAVWSSMKPQEGSSKV